MSLSMHKNRNIRGEKGISPRLIWETDEASTPRRAATSISFPYPYNALMLSMINAFCDISHSLLRYPISPFPARTGKAAFCPVFRQVSPAKPVSARRLQSCSGMGISLVPFSLSRADTYGARQQKRFSCCFRFLPRSALRDNPSMVFYIKRPGY